MLSTGSTGRFNVLKTCGEKDASSTVSCSDIYLRIGSTGRFPCLTLIPVHLLLEPREVLQWHWAITARVGTIWPIISQQKILTWPKGHAWRRHPIRACTA